MHMSRSLDDKQHCLIYLGGAQHQCNKILQVQVVQPFSSNCPTTRQRRSYCKDVGAAWEIAYVVFSCETLNQIYNGLWICQGRYIPVYKLFFLQVRLSPSARSLFSSHFEGNMVNGFPMFPQVSRLKRGRQTRPKRQRDKATAREKERERERKREQRKTHKNKKGGGREGNSKFQPTRVAGPVEAGNANQKNAFKLKQRDWQTGCNCIHQGGT